MRKCVFLAVLIAFLGISHLREGPSVRAGIKEKNDLRQISLFYKTFEVEFGKPPQTLPDFLNYIKRDAPALHKALADGKYVLVLGKKVGANQVLAYEKKPDSKGFHAVVRGDQSVTTLTRKGLKEALKK
jgi:hypothetical protein